MRFVHLHTHSHYSLLDGLAKIDEIIEAAKEKKMEALALTDHGVMYGVIEFYQKAKKAGIKPIIGVEVYILPFGESVKNQDYRGQYHHLVLLAENVRGYHNLIKLTTKAHLEGFYYKPRIDWELLKQHKEGLIALSACLGGEIADAIVHNQQTKAVKLANAFQDILGKNNFYLELQPHNHAGKQQKVNKALIDISRETKVPLVATNDIHYLKPDDDQAHDILLCLQTKKKKADRDRLSMLGENYSFKSEKEMSDSFRDCHEAIKNTVKIAKRCNVEIPFGQVILPEFDTHRGESPQEYLETLCKEGIAKRFKNKITKEVEERLEYELDVIDKMGFATYFLVVQDFVNWAKEQGIIVGPARGSAASSLVTYLLNITSINPLEYNLLFERFLNPDRVSPPDFDIDFTDTRRDEVIRYVESKYGKDRVSQVITFGTMAARAAVRDVGRVMGLSYSFCDQIAKLIPMFTTLDKALALIPELKEAYDTNEEARLLIDNAKRLEGVARHCSTHACAVLIVPGPLTEYTPLQYASSDDRTVVSQYSLHPVEDLGLLKIDFLGLKNLSIIETAIDIIKKMHGKDIDFDALPLDDKKTFKLFQQGQTTGVFQLESSGMKRYLKQLKPTEINDIIAMISLYRPGPMEFIPDYIAGKHKGKKVHYLVPQLRPILEETYGIAVYQEQVMQIARELAGFSYAEADVLRKAVGKKIKNLLDEQKQKMIEGMMKNHIDSNTAEMIWQFIEPFARYGFNRAHASGYAMIAYQTAWLKSRFPVEFMASLLTADQGDTDRIALLVDECVSMNIEVLPPDINESYSTFTVVAESLKTKQPRIRFGLLAIKNLGETVTREIIKERKVNGSYRNLENFLERVKTKDLNKKSLESLVKSGALDQFGERNQMLVNMDNLLRFIREVNKTAAIGQVSLFESSEVMLPHQLRLSEAVPATQKEKLQWEKELLGLYVTEHPFMEYETVLKNKIIPLAEVGLFLDEGQIAVGGIIAAKKRVVTKAGDSMLFVKLEDSTKNMEVIVFPSIFEQTRHIWQEDRVVVVIGKLSDKDGEIKLLANEVAELNEDNIKEVIAGLNKKGVSRNKVVRSHINDTKAIAIRLPKTVAKELSEKLKVLFSHYPGRFPVYLKIIDENDHKVKHSIRTNYFIDFNEAIKVQIEELVAPWKVNLEELLP